MDRARRRRHAGARGTASGAVVVLLLAALGLVVAPTATAAGGRIAIDAPATVVAGVPFDVTVTAVDATGEVARGYRGTVRFSTNDRLVRVLPGRYAFTEADSGTHTFAGVTLVDTGQHRIKVGDVARPRLRDAASVEVANAGATLEGEVLAGLDPIEGAVVTVYDAVTGRRLAKAPADICCYRYSITGLPAGDIKVGAVKRGSDLLPDYANDQDTLEDADIFTLAPGQTLEQSWEAEDFGPYLDLGEPLP
jgi:hypothetical protein